MLLMDGSDYDFYMQLAYLGVNSWIAVAVVDEAEVAAVDVVVVVVDTDD